LQSKHPQQPPNRGKGLDDPSSAYALEASTLSSDGKRMAYLLPADPEKKTNRLQICDVQTGKVLQRFDESSDRSYVEGMLAFSPKGEYLASADRYNIHLWDTTTGKKANTFRGHRGDVSRVAFTPDGKYLASASRDGTVLIWEIK
jgi:WD40 repeat protein